MKNNAKTHREIIAVIGIALLLAGITKTSRGDDGKNFADQPPGSNASAGCLVKARS